MVLPRTTDSFTHTVHLDCSCRIRLNLLNDPSDIKRGDFLFCTKGHSAKHRDGQSNEFIYLSDREVVAVICEPFDGVADA